MSAAVPTLSLLEARILGVLVEKQHTVPDIYPLSLNALTAGCNQKTSRDPVLHANESDVQAGIDRLRSASLVVESSGGRVMRYAHNVERVLGLPSQAVALIAAMMLRGPQTVGELRISCDRLHRFADGSAVEGFLHELAERGAGALVVMLPRLPGARESRWMHLLSGPPAADARADADATPGPPPDAALQAEVAALKESVAELRDEIALLKTAIAGLRPAPEEDGA
ncbi:MAG: YceH family protein [Betaproteobacteria bacterium]